MSDFDPDRRKVLMAGGATLTIALAGCLGDDDDNGFDVDDDVPDDVAEHMQEANNWDGSMADNTGQDTVDVTITDDPDFAYDPSGMFISEGTEVTWEWDHDGDSHTVTHDNGDEFDSGLISGAGETFTHTFDDTGTYLMVCTPHAGVGHLGAVVVE